MSLEKKALKDDIGQSPCELEPCPCDPTSPNYIERDDTVVYTHEKGLLILCSTLPRKELEGLIDRRWAYLKMADCPNHCIIDARGLFHYHYHLRPKAHITIEIPPTVGGEA